MGNSILVVDQDDNNVDAGAPSVEVNGALQVILAEKRTAMAMLRTGIAVMILPMSVVSFLVATSSLYEALHVNYLLIPLLGAAALLMILAGYLIIRSMSQLHTYDRMLRQLRRDHPHLRSILD